VVCVGGWRSPGRIREALDQVDAVALARPLVRQPDLPRKWREGSEEPAACISCGGCFVTARKGHLECQQLMENQD
jgi:2,4-dienoyl-CoA reductase-like NADH-dependent reductase (Old Yellow Enzyme family)